MKFLIPLIIAAIITLTVKLGFGSTSPSIAPSIDVQPKITEYADAWSLEPALVKAIAKVESDFKPGAKNPADPSYGLMQITPALAYDYGIIVNYRNPSEFEIEMIFDIDNNLNVACWFLNKLKKYSFAQQVQSYNVGERGYKDGRRNYDYLNKVRSYYEKYS